MTKCRCGWFCTREIKMCTGETLINYAAGGLVLVGS